MHTFINSDELGSQHFCKEEWELKARIGHIVKMGTSHHFNACESAGGGVLEEHSPGWQWEMVIATTALISSGKWKEGCCIGRGFWKERGFRDAKRGRDSAGPVRGWKKK